MDYEVQIVEGELNRELCGFRLRIKSIHVICFHAWIHGPVLFICDLGELPHVTDMRVSSLIRRRVSYRPANVSHQSRRPRSCIVQCKGK